jgi:hypothetical protein
VTAVADGLLLVALVRAVCPMKDFMSIRVHRPTVVQCRVQTLFVVHLPLSLDWQAVHRLILIASAAKFDF